MGGISNQSPAILKKTTGAANVGTAAGTTVEARIVALDAAVSDAAAAVAALDSATDDALGLLNDDVLALQGADTALDGRVDSLEAGQTAIEEDVLALQGDITAMEGQIGSAGGLVFLSSVAASDSATVDIETTFNSTYDEYVILATDVKTAAGGILRCRFKVSGAYDAAANYEYYFLRANTSSGESTGTYGNPVNQIDLTISQATATNESCRLQMNISNPTNTNRQKAIDWTGHSMNGSAMYTCSGVGRNIGTGAVSGIRFFYSAGNIATGTFRLYGIKKA